MKGLMKGKSSADVSKIKKENGGSLEQLCTTRQHTDRYTGHIQKDGIRPHTQKRQMTKQAAER
jgi:hypothetical protein